MSEPIQYPESQSQAAELNEAAGGLASADTFDPVIEFYKRGVDRTILRENLKLSPQQRSEKFASHMSSSGRLREVPVNEASRPPAIESLGDESMGITDEPAPPDAHHPLIDAIKAGVDRSLLRKNLELTQAERAEKFVKFARFAEALRQAGRRAREQDPAWGLK